MENPLALASSTRVTSGAFSVAQQPTKAHGAVEVTQERKKKKKGCCT
jgi:hypothetical protein